MNLNVNGFKIKRERNNALEITKERNNHIANKKMKGHNK